MAVVSLADLPDRLAALPAKSPAKSPSLSPGPVRKVVPRDLAELAERVRPVTSADGRLVPVPAELGALLPQGGLRRGSVVAVTHHGLLLRTLAPAMAAGSWAAAVGVANLGLAAAAELGCPLERFAVITRPPLDSAATVVAAIVDAVELVIVGPGVVTRAADARRLSARLRERGGILFSLGPWTEAVDVRLDVATTRWSGVDHGHGHLAGAELEVVVGGRGAASQGRRGWLGATAA